MKPASSSLPIAVIGAGPVGLAAAAHLLERNLPFIILESGAAVGANLRQWAHVRLFSPWEFNLDPAATRLLERQGWSRPDGAAYPTGGDIVSAYLAPLAAVPALAAALRFKTRVVGITRRGHDRMNSADSRATAPFRLRLATPAGESELLARAVIDASGTWQTPNPLGADGLPALGEAAARTAIRHGIPDATGAERARYAGKRVLVVGSGHSAFNTLLDLARLADTEPRTSVVWAVRRSSLEHVFGGGERDRLAARGALGQAVQRLVQEGRMKLELGFRLSRLHRAETGWIAADGERQLPPVDEIVGATGFRPDLSTLQELRLDLDPAIESPRTLGPMIDPNLHSCGTVRPHGARELAQPEAGFYLAGMKSYGRAPTFLLRTGYEQVRSIVAELAGDHAAAARVELVLPATGVCTVDSGDRSAASATSAPDAAAGCGCDSAAPAEVAPAASTCCGGPPTENGDACCRLDETKKAAGESGCGCTDARDPAPVAAGATRCCG